MKRLTTEEFISRSKEVHGDKYDYSKTVYVNQKTKVCIICPVHGEFWQVPDDHMRGVGCRKCGYVSASSKNRKILVDFINKAKQAHGDKYDYSQSVYINSKTPIKIICPIHGEFMQVPTIHVQGHGCMLCGFDRMKESITSNTEEFIKKARKIHGNKYDYSNVHYINDKTKVEIVCPIHGSFLQTPDCHLSGRGCNQCKSEKARKALFGVGYYDIREPMSKGINRKIYHIWRAMLARCYSDRVQRKQPTYIGCSVCNEWFLFSNFKEYYINNAEEGWCLDKDILYKGNKVYSPQTCCFVPNEINVIISGRKKKSNLPKGVKKTKYNRYQAVINKQYNDINLGSYPTPEAAFQAYKKAKEEWIKEVADKWKDKLKPNVYEALMNYQVEITD